MSSYIVCALQSVVFIITRFSMPIIFYIFLLSLFLSVVFVVSRLGLELPRHSVCHVSTASFTQSVKDEVFAVFACAWLYK